MQLDFFIQMENENYGMDFSLDDGITATGRTVPNKDSSSLKASGSTILASKPIANSSSRERPSAMTLREARLFVSTDTATAPILNSNTTTTSATHPTPPSIADATSSSALSQLFQQLSDRELDQVTRLKARQEQETTLDLLLHLKAIEARRVYSLLAYSSMWDYCVKGLGYSESAASERVAAMRLLKQSPEAEAKLRAGQLNLTTAAQLHRFFQGEEKSGNAVAPEQKSALIEQAAGHSKREVEKLLLTESFRNRGYSVTGSVDNADRTTTKTDTRDSTINPVGTSTNLDNTRPLPKIFKETTRLVTPDLTELKLYADEELMTLLTRMKELRGPQQSHAELFKTAMRVYVEKKDPLRKEVRRQKAKSRSEAAASDSFTKQEGFIKKTKTIPRRPAYKTSPNIHTGDSRPTTHPMSDNCLIPSTKSEADFTTNAAEHAQKSITESTQNHTAQPAPHNGNKTKQLNTAGEAVSNTHIRSRYISAATRQALFLRSNGQCEYHDPQTNQRCPCKTKLEIEHTQPFAQGGRHTLSNLKIYCGPHNQLAALKIFGRQKMEKYWKN